MGRRTRLTHPRQAAVQHHRAAEPGRKPSRWRSTCPVAATPADGGFCTFQSVVNGAACPWKLDCENCDHFVLSGADLLYWRGKQEQWRSIAEHAPDDATADYLHHVFEPTASAIKGLEQALAGMGLLQEALNLDLRRPQDYFHRIWSTNFRATDLVQIDGGQKTRPTRLEEPA